MIWNFGSTYKKSDTIVTPKCSRKIAWFILVIWICFGAVGFGVLLIKKQSDVGSGNQDDHREHINFDDMLKQVCSNPKLPLLEYKGVESFFNYLMTPDTKYCYSWVDFGGEKIIIPSQTTNLCRDEIRKNKKICFNKEFEMNQDPCLIYSFGLDDDSQFERDIDMFSCEIHSFDHLKVIIGENVKKSEFRMEHAWDISESSYDHPTDKGVIKRRSLDFIITVLNHKNRVIKYLKSDLQGREWILLRNVIMNYQNIDIQQIGVQLHIPMKINNMTGTERHHLIGNFFKVFQGLQCAGYKYIQGRPVEYFSGKIKIPEVKKIYYSAYEVNFAKVIN